MARKVAVEFLWTDRTTTGASATHEPFLEKRTYQAYGNTSAGAGSSTIDIEVSLDGTAWIVQRTITLTLGVAVTTDGYTTDAPWRFTRANVTAISGTNAKVSVMMGNMP